MSAPTLTHGRGDLAPPRGFPPDHPWDGVFFPVWVALIWTGVLAGFVPEIVRHVVSHEPAYPPIIHIHGVVFVSWLVLLTAQVALVRTGRFEWHRRLGAAGVALAVLMVGVGPATAYVMDRLEFGTARDNTPFLFVQMSDIAAFAVLAASGVALRARPADHKRLMLMATLYIADAGFSRWLGDPITGRFGLSFAPYFAGLYLGSDALMLGIGAYDLITRRRLNGAWLAAIAFVAAVQMLSVHMRWDPAWKVTATRLLGH